MTHTIKSIALLVTLGPLAACGGAETGGGGGTGPILDEPTAPSITSSNVVSARSFINSVNSRRDTPGNVFSVLPIGSATYSGQALTNLSIAGEDSVDGLSGNVRLTADLGGLGNSVTGSITNIHTRSGDTPVERLGGSLAINGTLNDLSKTMSATVAGQLSGVVGDGERGDLNVTGSMTGRTQDTRTGSFLGVPTYDLGTGIAGGVSGSISGSESGRFSGSWAVTD